MKKLNPVSIILPFAIFLTCSFLSMVSCSHSEQKVQYYTSGEVSRRHTEINGKKEGAMTEYYKDGKIRGVRLFENDIQVGKTVFYFPSGKIKEVQYFEDGKLNGGDTVFYEDGKPEFVRTFTLGKLDGYIRKWDSTGVVIYEAKYANDTLVEVKGQAIHRDTIMTK